MLKKKIKIGRKYRQRPRFIRKILKKEEKKFKVKFSSLYNENVKLKI